MVNHKYYLWYLPREKRYFNECTNNYDGFIISAHILAHNGNAFSSILDSTNKPYFIDPETSVFQHSNITLFYNEKGLIRSSWKKLIDIYDSVIKEAISNNRLLEISDLKNVDGSYKQQLDIMTKNILRFQETAIKQKISGLSRLIGLVIEADLIFLVSPYFYFSSISDPWYDINIKILEKTVNYISGLKKYAVICTNKMVLNNENIEKINDDYNISGIDGFLLWIDTFDEVVETSDYLEKILQLTKKLSNDGKEVINLYGGYFSVLSSYWGMTGHATGVGYRDSRAVYIDPIFAGPPGGPLPRYYIPCFHRKVILDEGIRYMTQFRELSCNCNICQNYPEVYNPRTLRSVRRFLMNKHFLNMRKNEVVEVTQNIYSTTINEIETILRNFRRHESILPVSHLSEWLNAMQRNIGLLD